MHLELNYKYLGSSRITLLGPAIGITNHCDECLVLRPRRPKLDPEKLLRYRIKVINDTMGPQSLVKSLLVFGVVPKFPTVNAELPAQRECLAALAAARKEMKKPSQCYECRRPFTQN